MRHTITLATTAAALLLALTACSSSDDDKAAEPSTAPSRVEQPSTTPTPAEAAALEGAVKAYTVAYFKGDTDATYATLSKRCQGKVTPEVYGAVVKQAAADYGNGHPATDVQANVSGTLARVSYKVAGLPKFDQQAQPWTREGGDWKYDAC